ncbi:unnamed protein product [Victoria cruziana]
MITWKDLYTVLTAVVPLYVAMILAYGSVRWWKIFSPDQCSGINRFVAVFAVPLLSFHFISTNNPYAMNLRFIAADTLQKAIILAFLALWSNLSARGNIDWSITIFSLSTLPNTLVMGIPLLIAMYGEFSGSLMVQIVVLQCIIWYTILLFLFEYRGAKILIMEQFPETAASIVSFKVDSDVVSLDGREFLQTEAEVGDDGKLHVTVRKSTSSRSVMLSPSRRSMGFATFTPRPSNLTGAEIYSLHSTPRGSSFNPADLYSGMGGGGAGSVHPRYSNFGQAEMYSLPTPRPSNFDEQHALNAGNLGFPGSAVNHYGHAGMGFSSFPPDASGHTNNNFPSISGAIADNSGSSGKIQKKSGYEQPQQLQVMRSPQRSRPSHHDAKELHMFVWSSSASPASEVSGLHVLVGQDFNGEHKSGSGDLGAKEIRMLIPDHHSPNGTHREHEDHAVDNFSFKRGSTTAEGEEAFSVPKEGPVFSAAALHPKLDEDGSKGNKQMPPASVMTRLILIMVWRKLIRNPNTYSSLIGVIWSLIAFRWNVSMPKIIQKSISILSDAGLGMAMFSLGLFMALQPRIIACGNSAAAFAMAVRFLTGPAVMAAASIIVGLRGVLLHVAIVQAALPQGIVPFVFAKEYNVHPAILSTAVIFGMLIALPITLVYYILLGL